MSIARLKAARINVCRSQELINDDIGEDAKKISQELKKAFSNAENTLNALYCQLSKEISWSDRNG